MNNDLLLTLPKADRLSDDTFQEMLKPPPDIEFREEQIEAFAESFERLNKGESYIKQFFSEYELPSQNITRSAILQFMRWMSERCYFSVFFNITDFAKEVGFSRQTVHHHLKDLTKHGILSKLRDGFFNKGGKGTNRCPVYCLRHYYEFAEIQLAAVK